MNYKIILYIITLTLFSAMIGGGAVYLATNYKGKPSVNENSESSETSSSSTKVTTSSSSLSDDKTNFSSAINKSSTKETIADSEEKPTGQKFTGWLGSTNIEMYLNFKQDKITGKYYNSYDKKWYTLDGNYEVDQLNQSGIIRLNEFSDGLINGDIMFSTFNSPVMQNSEEQQRVYNSGLYNYSGGISAGLYYNNKIKTLAGFYREKIYTGKEYDMFVSANQADIDNFVEVTKELTIVNLKNPELYQQVMFEKEGKYYFTYEDWKIPKDIKKGDKVKVIGKLRSYVNPVSFNLNEPTGNDYSNVKSEGSNQGFFQISDVKKI
jgi:hypothetical protein